MIPLKTLLTSKSPDLHAALGPYIIKPVESTYGYTTDFLAIENPDLITLIHERPWYTGPNNLTWNLFEMLSPVLPAGFLHPDLVREVVIPEEGSYYVKVNNPLDAIDYWAADRWLEADGATRDAITADYLSLGGTLTEVPAQIRNLVQDVLGREVEVEYDFFYEDREAVARLIHDFREVASDSLEEAEYDCMRNGPTDATARQTLAEIARRERRNTAPTTPAPPSPDSSGAPRKRRWFKRKSRTL